MERACVLSCVQLSVTPWPAAHQAPLSMGYGSKLPFPSPGDLPDPGIKPLSPALAGGFFTPEPAGKLYYPFNVHSIYSDTPSSFLLLVICVLLIFS